MKFQPRSVLETHEFGQLFNGYFCSLLYYQASGERNAVAEKGMMETISLQHHYRFTN